MTQIRLLYAHEGLVVSGSNLSHFALLVHMPNQVFQIVRASTVSCLLSLSFSSIAFAAQRMGVPGGSSISLPAGGQGSIPAYCLDSSESTPKPENIYTKVLDGPSNSISVITNNGTLTFDQAINRNLIKVQGDKGYDHLQIINNTNSPIQVRVDNPVVLGEEDKQPFGYISDYLRQLLSTSFLPLQDNIWSSQGNAEAIREVQSILKKAGYYDHPINGILSVEMIDSLENYISNVGDSDVSGDLIQFYRKLIQSSVLSNKTDNFLRVTITMSQKNGTSSYILSKSLVDQKNEIDYEIDSESVEYRDIISLLDHLKSYSTENPNNIIYINLDELGNFSPRDSAAVESSIKLYTQQISMNVRVISRRSNSPEYQRSNSLEYQRSNSLEYQNAFFESHSSGYQVTGSGVSSEPISGKLNQNIGFANVSFLSRRLIFSFSGQKPHILPWFEEQVVGKYFGFVKIFNGRKERFVFFLTNTKEIANKTLEFINERITNLRTIGKPFSNAQIINMARQDLISHGVIKNRAIASPRRLG